MQDVSVTQTHSAGLACLMFDILTKGRQKVQVSQPIVKALVVFGFGYHQRCDRYCRLGEKLRRRLKLDATPRTALRLLSLREEE